MKKYDLQCNVPTDKRVILCVFVHVALFYFSVECLEIWDTTASADVAFHQLRVLPTSKNIA